MCFSFILHIHLFLNIFCVHTPKDILGQFLDMCPVNPSIFRTGNVFPKSGQEPTLPYFPLLNDEQILTGSVQFSSVAQSCLTLCDPVNRSMPALPIHYQLPEFTQTHVHRVGNAIQPSHPLSSRSPPALNLSQHQGLFK